MSDAITTVQPISNTTNEQPQVAKAPRVPKDTSAAKMSPPKPKGAANVVGQRQPLGKDDTRKRSFETIRPKVVKAAYTFKLHKDANEEYPVVSELDFSNCSEEDILFWAASSVRIILQGRLRKMGNSALDATVFAVVDVQRELAEGQRSPVDQGVRDIRALARAAGVSEERARVLLEGIIAQEGKAKK
jgi:hypothetical protein